MKHPYRFTLDGHEHLSDVPVLSVREILRCCPAYRRMEEVVLIDAQERRYMAASGLRLGVNGERYTTELVRE